MQFARRLSPLAHFVQLLILAVFVAQLASCFKAASDNDELPFMSVSGREHTKRRAQTWSLYDNSEVRRSSFANIKIGRVLFCSCFAIRFVLSASIVEQIHGTDGYSIQICPVHNCKFAYSFTHNHFNHLLPSPVYAPLPHTQISNTTSNFTSIRAINPSY